MNKFNVIPVIVQQMIEDLKDKSTPEHVKYNKAQMLEAIRDQCDLAIKTWEKQKKR